MMNLPSDGSGGNAGGLDLVEDFPVRLLNSGLGKKDVSLLEFNTVDWNGSEIKKVVAPLGSGEIETRLKEDVAALNGRLQLQAEEIAGQIEAAQKDAILIAREEWASELDERVVAERKAIQQVCEQFSKERAMYFAGVEAEVVKLALAIAARILHREAQLDPLLLTAAVRVALAKVADGSGIVMRVPVEEMEMWYRVLNAEIDATVKLMGDERLCMGGCILETKVGTVELGVKAQLAEVERGFFDLLQQRPA
jgi:flagellar assembly protein FliH